MTHYSDDDLVLHYYGELAEADAHLALCGECAARARELALFLTSLPDDVPERGDRYGLDVWQRVRPHLGQSHAWWQVPVIRWGLAAAAVIAIAASSFVAGRFSTVPSKQVVATTQATPVTHTSDDSLRRVLLLSVADHLERSDRVLTDIMNAPGGGDISAEQDWAADLVAANRLYRQDAVAADEASVANVLDELERALLDIVHRPADASAADFDQMRRRIDSAALLFKVRVMSSQLRQQELAPDAASSKRATSPVS
jgi:hypothetical protein